MLPIMLYPLLSDLDVYLANRNNLLRFVSTPVDAPNLPPAYRTDSPTPLL
nr:hypothetical protein Q903MT_gene1963 [Picea sitchensis]